MAGAQRKVSHMEIIKGFKMLLLTSEFLLLVLSLVANNMGNLQTNPDIHDISTRYITYLYIKHTDMLGTNQLNIKKETVIWEYRNKVI